MKKLFFTSFFLLVLSFLYTENNRVQLSVELSPEYGGGTLLFYDEYSESDYKAKHILSEIDKSKKVSSIITSNKVFTEGRYIIFIFDNEKLIRQYELINYDTMYCITEDRYYKTEVYQTVIKSLMFALLEKRYGFNTD